MFARITARLLFILVLLLFPAANGAAVTGAVSTPPPPEPGRLTPAREYERIPPGGRPLPSTALLADHTLPDLDAGWIERAPAYPYTAAKTWPDPAETVTFTAHIANRGLSATGTFTYRWAIDGAAQPTRSHPGLAPGESFTPSIQWAWQSGLHTVRLTLDPTNAVNEFSETNNTLEDRTNALTLGIYVEQSVYDFFNQNLWQAGWGGNSFDDWMQRHVNIWNGIFAASIHPLTPQGILDRVRLGKVVVLPDGGNHCNTNLPAWDPELDLIWGFHSETVGVASNPGCPGWSPRYRDDTATWDHDMGLIHELTHARYLIDLYGMNVDGSTNYLSSAVDAATTTLPLDQVPDAPEYSPPFYMIVDGETVLCQGKTAAAATGCARGQEGTTARGHPSGAPVYAHPFLVHDGLGNALAGSPAMPIDGWMFYRDPYFFTDLMDSGSGYSEHSAYAWNRIAGQRARCGNANAPCNIGEYLDDQPAHHFVELHWPNGDPVAGALVEVYEAGPFPTWYGQSYSATPSRVTITDAGGRAYIGDHPFGDPVMHTYGICTSVVLMKVVAQGMLGTVFVDVTSANLAYWRGEHNTGIYPLTLTNVKDIPVSAPQADFSASNNYGVFPLEVSFEAWHTGGGLLSGYQWDFGDGVIAERARANPTHTYTHPGRYTVRLLAYGPGGATQVVKEGLVNVAGIRLYLPAVIKGGN